MSDGLASLTAALGVARRVGKAVPFVVGLPAALCGGYVGTLTIAARRHRPLSDTDRSVKFAFVVPAHNEAFGITETIGSLRAVDYPRHEFRVIVIADNCTDDTAAVARAAGAQVLERRDDHRRSKGFALSDMLPRILNEFDCDAVVVVDADTIVSENILRLAAGRIARGEHALQVRYGVRNPDESWRTQLLAVAFAAFHDVRSSGREYLRLSCGLRGNGMVFTRHALTVAPHNASSLVEDLEHGLDLADVGIRVAYVHNASVLAEMPGSAAASASQRDRWERGRAQFRGRAVKTMLKGMRAGDPVRMDLAADVLVPPLGTVAAMTVGSVAMAAGASLLRRRADYSVILAAIAVLGLGGHVGAGWKASGTGVRGLKALVHVPAYVVWKVRDKVLRKRTGGDESAWVRTQRSAETLSEEEIVSGSDRQRPMLVSNQEYAS